MASGTLWAQGDVSEDMAVLWTAAIVHPTDYGQIQMDEQGDRRRTLRPVACSEALAKMAETVIIDVEQSQFDDAMRHHQLGCGVPMEHRLSSMQSGHGQRTSASDATEQRSRAWHRHGECVWT